MIDAVHAAAPADKLYGINGLQFLPFNTLYQFAADPRVHEPGVQALLIPDLLGYWLTGQRVAEDTNASTTGLLDARTGQWSTDLIDTLGLPTGSAAAGGAAGHRRRRTHPGGRERSSGWTGR